MQRRKTKDNLHQKKSRKFKNYLILFLLFLPLFYVIFSILKWPIYNYLLDNFGRRTEAKIIDERNVLGKGIITQMYSYSFEFCIDNNCYKTDTRSQEYKIGEKIEVEYLEYIPSINRIAKK